MKIAVFGTGGVGGYFGGRLAEAGLEVIFIARGEHMAAIRKKGLRVNSIAGDFHIKPARVESNPAMVGEVDAVLLAVKSWQVEEAAASLGSMIGPQTAVLPMLNGVDIADRLLAVLGGDAVLGGLCRIIAKIGGPGLIEHMAAPPSLCFAELNNQPSQRVDRLRAAFERCHGIKVIVPVHIQAAIWEKLLFVGPLGAVGAVTRVPIGNLRSQPETRQMLQAAMREVEALARVRGVPLDEDVVQQSMAIVDRVPQQSTTSMQRDIMAGRPSEMLDQVAVIERMGKALGVPTPIHAFIHHSLLPQERVARGLEPGSFPA